MTKSIEWEESDGAICSLRVYRSWRDTAVNVSQGTTSICTLDDLENALNSEGLLFLLKKERDDAIQLLNSLHDLVGRSGEHKNPKDIFWCAQSGIINLNIQIGELESEVKKLELQISKLKQKLFEIANIAAIDVGE